MLNKTNQEISFIGGYMIKGNKVYDPLTNTWSTGYWVKDDKGNYYPVW